MNLNRNRLINLLVIYLALSFTSVTQAKTTITFLHWDNEKTPVNRGIDLFEAENPDIDVEVIQIPRAEYDQKILTMAAGGVDMDVFYVPETKFAPWAQMGWLYDITDNLRKDGLDDDFLPAEQMRSTYKNRWYGIGLTWNTFQLFYNPSMLNEVGVALPPNQAAKAWTWTQFTDAARKLHKVKGDGTVERWGAQFPPNLFVLSSLLFSNGASFFDANGRAVIDSPKALQVFDAISDMLNGRQIARNAGSGGLINNVTAMTFSGSFELGTTFKDTTFKPSVGAMPYFNAPAAFLYGPYHGIFAKTKHPQEAWRLFKFLISEQYAEMWVRDGVWTPTRKSFVSRAKLQNMTNPKIHPERYLDETTSYISQVGRATGYPIGWDSAQPTFAQGVGPIWTGQVPAAQVMPGLVKQINTLMSDAQMALLSGK